MNLLGVTLWLSLLSLLLLPIIPKTYGSELPIIRDRQAMGIYDANDKTDSGVVRKALELFNGDLQTLGVTPGSKISKWQDASIILGTLGSSKLIDSLAKRTSWNTNQLRKAWDAFEMTSVTIQGRTYLIIIGSNDRGTAYGLMEISRMMGISPWAWWADVKPRQVCNFSLPADFELKKQPSVAYRGIFINDEDWGILPWSNQTHAPSPNRHLIDKKTYEKVFELLLRLRGNIIWPAMHECTVPFYEVEGAKETAHEYGIVIGTSHCEPMMRNNAGEWKKSNYGPFNYLTNKQLIQQYWDARIKSVSNYENFYTIGMRGVHDGRMIGVRNDQEYRDALHQVMKDQRGILAQHLKRPLPEVPQSIVVYKEVLNVYKAGLQIPDDVTLVWCDDNHGYITLLSSERERKRSGGAGVYYHASYWGNPHDYLWLASTAPGLLYSEMKRAWDYNARKLWILNVGDIKPAEYLTELFLDMAWDMNEISASNLQKRMSHYAERDMGKDHGEQIALIMGEYYRLNTIRRPEFMGWSRVEEEGSIKQSEFSAHEFGDELQRRMDVWADLSHRVLTLKETLPKEQQDAYFQLVEYPVLAATAMNAKFLYWQKAHLYASINSELSREYMELSNQAYQKIKELTAYYNSGLANGKWNGIMSMNPRNLPVYQPLSAPETAQCDQSIVLLNNSREPLKEAEVQTISLNSKNSRPVPIIAIASRPDDLQWNIVNKDAWIIVEEQTSPVSREKRLAVSVASHQTGPCQGSLSLKIGERQFDFNVMLLGNSQGIAEDNRAVAWNADQYVPEKSHHVTVVPLMGHSGRVIKLDGPESKAVYDVEVSSSGEAVLMMGFVPTHAPNDEPLICRVQIGNDQPKELTLNVKIKSEDWKVNVLRNQTLKRIPVSIPNPGKYVITVTAPGGAIMPDQFMIEFEKDRKHYEIPVQRHHIH